MANKVKLKDIIAEMEMQFDGYRSFINTRSGEVISVAEDDLIDAEDGKPIDNLHDWQIENLEIANDVVENIEDYKELPTRYDINEYDIIEDFCLTIHDEKIQKILLITIAGKGAFRRFNDMVKEFEIEMDWYKYRDKRYRQIAVEWCQINEVEFID